MWSRYHTLVFYCFCFRAPLRNMAALPCPSGPQTWKGMETRSGYSWQPQKSSVCMYRNIKTPRYKLRCNQGEKQAVLRKRSLAVRGDCKKRAGLQLSGVGMLSTTMSGKLESIHKAFFAFVFTKQTDRIRDQSRPCQWRCGETSSSSCEGTGCKVLS